MINESNKIKQNVYKRVYTSEQSVEVINALGL